MTARPNDDMPPELLAGYADGELSPAQRDAVERWLANNPHQRELLETQESLSPRNTDLWQGLTTPLPTARAWSDSFDRIDAGVPLNRPFAWVSRLGSLALAATAATLLFLLPGRQPLCEVVPDCPHDNGQQPLAPATDEEPYVMATAHDIRILSLPECAAELIVIGDHPLSHSMMLLARLDELEFHFIGADLIGRLPAPPIGQAPDDAPMLWAPREP